VVFFDVDGTLVPQTSSGQYLAESLGHLATVRDAEARYAAGALTNQEVSVLDAGGWVARTRAEVRGFLAGLPLVDGIADTVSWCRRHGLVPVLATLAWDVVGAYLCERFGFVRACGPSLEMVDGRYTGQVATHFDEMDKRAFALTVAADLGVEPVSCAAIGDSRSDLPLFAEVGLAIAFNPTPAARAAAHVAVEGADLGAVVPVLATWLDTAR
jgi:phosphoserine phosphatase